MSGAPGSGKSTVAVALARELRWPVLSKDVIKEALFESLGVGDVEWSKRLGRSATAVLFATARELPSGVLEAFWRREQSLEGLRALGADLVEVHCACPIEVARSRFADRTSRARHPGHLDERRIDDPDIWASVDAQEPLGLSEVVVVDTTCPIDAVAIADSVRAAFGELDARNGRAGWSG